MAFALLTLLDEPAPAGATKVAFDIEEYSLVDPPEGIPDAPSWK